jgi:hypothetical protein
MKIRWKNRENKEFRKKPNKYETKGVGNVSSMERSRLPHNTVKYERH